jgi:hypothetical protein
LRRRLLGRTSGGGGFRYLHDEISGGVHAWGKIKSKSSYVGNSFELDNTDDYGFVDDIADLDSMLVDFPTGVTGVSIWYEQLNGDDLGTVSVSTQAGKFDSSNVDLCLYSLSSGDGNILSGATSSLTDSDARTVIVVLKRITAPSSTAQVPYYSYSNAATNRLAIQMNNSYTYVRLNGGGGETRFSVGAVSDLNTNLFVIDYDGSGLLAGFNFYINDMSTSLPKSLTAETVVLQDVPMDDYNIGCTAGLEFEGYVYEVHEFNKVLSESERNLAKEILEQEYTFGA